MIVGGVASLILMFFVCASLRSNCGVNQIDMRLLGYSNQDDVM